MFKLSFYVPEDHLDRVKQAVFESGAGRIGSYDSCCWQSTGLGQFRPLGGATPYIGCVGEVEQVAEVKVEMVCAEEHIREVIQALRYAHPYEEPAFDVIRLEVF